MTYPAFDRAVKKIPISTTIHPDFKEWLDSQGIPLATWIEQQYEIQHEQGQIDEIKKLLKSWIDRAYKQADEIRALKFRTDYLETKIMENGLKITPPPATPSPKMADTKPKPDKTFKDKHGGII